MAWQQNRKRKNQVLISLSDEEYDKLIELKERSGRSMNEIIRKLIMGCKIREVPPLDFWGLTKQIRYVGNNLNQIAKGMHLHGQINAAAYEDNAEKVFEILNSILEAVLRGE